MIFECCIFVSDIDSERSFVLYFHRNKIRESNFQNTDSCFVAKFFVYQNNCNLQQKYLKGLLNKFILNQHGIHMECFANSF